MSETGPLHVSRALSELFAIRGYARVDASRQLQQVWETIAGPQIGRQTRVAGIQRGVLQVGVATSTLMSELRGFYEQELLGKLKTEHPELRIRGLKFRLKSDLPHN